MGGPLPRSLVDLRGLSPILENQDAIRHDAERDNYHISSIRAHVARRHFERHLFRP